MSFLEKFKNKKVAIGVGVFVIVALGVGIFIYNKNKINGDDLSVDENYIETYTIADNEKIFINGVITPTKTQDFNPNQENMSKVNVTNGKVVNEGDLLYTTKNQDAIDQIDDLKSQVNTLKNQVDKLKKANSSNDSGVNSEISGLNSDISKLNSQISSLEKKAYLETYAPFAGKVYLNETSDGPEQSAFMTLESNEYYMKGQASEQDLPKLQIDDPVDVLVFSNNKKLTGRISYISDRPSTAINDMNMGGQSNLSHYDIIISFENQEELTNGFHVQASIEVRDSMVKIPTSAVLESKKDDKTENYVFEDLNGILKKRVIEINDQNDEFTTVKSGLDKNISIVRYPSEDMKEGDPVNTGNVPNSEDGAENSSDEKDKATTEDGAEHSSDEKDKAPSEEGAE